MAIFSFAKKMLPIWKRKKGGFTLVGIVWPARLSFIHVSIKNSKKSAILNTIGGRRIAYA
jgi:hypothetical protein